MAILDDLAALNVDPRNPDAVIEAIRTLSLSPAGRQQLANEYTHAAQIPLTPEHRRRLLEA